MLKFSLKAARVNCEASAKEMAEYVGVSIDTIRSWEQKKSYPTVEKTIKILEFFNSKGFPITLDDIKF